MIILSLPRIPKCRAIATMLGVSDKTVTGVREELVACSEISNSLTVIRADGVVQPRCPAPQFPSARHSSTQPAQGTIYIYTSARD